MQFPSRPGGQSVSKALSAKSPSRQAAKPPVSQPLGAWCSFQHWYLLCPPSPRQPETRIPHPHLLPICQHQVYDHSTLLNLSPLRRSLHSSAAGVSESAAHIQHPFSADVAQSFSIAQDYVKAHCKVNRREITRIGLLSLLY
jgi:hypothetical protein